MFTCLGNINGMLGLSIDFIQTMDIEFWKTSSDHTVRYVTSGGGGGGQFDLTNRLFNGVSYLEMVKNVWVALSPKCACYKLHFNYRLCTYVKQI